MGIRETINKKSAVSTTLVVCAIAGLVLVIAMELRGSKGEPTDMYYTTDDGQTWFADSVEKLPPFDHDGAKAVRCYVFKGKSGKFVGLLEKFSDDSLASLARRDPKVPLAQSPPVMVKKPGDKTWKSCGSDQAAAMLMYVTAPDGSTDIERVMP